MKKDKEWLLEEIENLNVYEDEFGGDGVYKSVNLVEIDEVMDLVNQLGEEIQFIEFQETERDTIEFPAGTTIEEAILELKRASNSSGRVVQCDFNGETLTSNMSLDEAFIILTGDTYEEHQKRIVEYEQKRKEEEKKFQEAIPTLISFWKEEGRNVLDEKHWDDWDKVVPTRMHDLYQGMELGNTLSIIKILNNGNADALKKAREELNNQGHSGNSYALVRAMVRYFDDDLGEDFYQFSK